MKNHDLYSFSNKNTVLFRRNGSVASCTTCLIFDTFKKIMIETPVRQSFISAIPTDRELSLKARFSNLIKVLILINILKIKILSCSEK